MYCKRSLIKYFLNRTSVLFVYNYVFQVKVDLVYITKGIHPLPILQLHIRHFCSPGSASHTKRKSSVCLINLKPRPIQQIQRTFVHFQSFNPISLVALEKSPVQYILFVPYEKRKFSSSYPYQYRHRPSMCRWLIGEHWLPLFTRGVFKNT